MFATTVQEFRKVSGASRYKFSAYADFVEIIAIDITPDSKELIDELLELGDDEPLRINSGLVVTRCVGSLIQFDLENGASNEPVEICLSYESCKPAFLKLKQLLN